MNAVMQITWKDLVILKRDKIGLFWIFLFPLMFSLFFGLIMGGGGKGSSKIPLIVVDVDETSDSRAFVEKLRSSDALDVRAEPMDKARDSVRLGKAAAFVVLPKGYGESAKRFWQSDAPVELGMDPARKAEAGLLQGLLIEASFGGMQAMFSDPKESRKMIQVALAELDRDAGEKSEQSKILRGFLANAEQFMGKLEPATLTAGGGFNMAERIRLVPVIREQTGARSPFEITFPSSILWGLIGCIMSFAVSIVDERQTGTLLRLRLSPMSWLEILAAKGASCFIVSCAVCTILMIVARVFFGVRIQNVFYLSIGIFSVGVCFTGLMMLLATMGRTERAVNGSGWGVLMPMAMLGGGMVPLAFMPPWMVQIGSISPFKWGVLAMEGAIWRDFSFSEMMLPCMILVAIGVVTFTVGVRILSRSEY